MAGFDTRVEDIRVVEPNAGRGPVARADRSAATIGQAVSQGIKGATALVEGQKEADREATVQDIRSTLEREGQEIAEATEFFRGAQSQIKNLKEDAQEEFLLAQVPNEIKGTTGFKLIKARLQQGKIDQTSANIAVSSRIKELINQNPQFAREIRQEAARLLNYDPAAEFKYRIADPTPEKKGPMTESQKKWADLQSQVDMGLITKEEAGTTMKFWQETQDDLLRVQQQEAADKIGTRKMEGIILKSNVATKQALHTFGLTTMKELQEQYGATGAFPNEVKQQKIAEIDQMIRAQTKELDNLAAAAAEVDDQGNPKYVIDQDVLQRRRDELNGLGESYKSLVRQDQLADFYKTYNDITKEGNKMVMHELMPVYTALVDAGFDTEFIRWLGTDKNIQKLVAANMEEFAGLTSDEISTMSTPKLLRLALQGHRSMMVRARDGKLSNKEKNYFTNVYVKQGTKALPEADEPIGTEISIKDLNSKEKQQTVPLGKRLGKTEKLSKTELDYYKEAYGAAGGASVDFVSSLVVGKGTLNERPPFLTWATDPETGKRVEVPMTLRWSEGKSYYWEAPEGADHFSYDVIISQQRNRGKEMLEALYHMSKTPDPAAAKYVGQYDPRAIVEQVNTHIQKTWATMKRNEAGAAEFMDSDGQMLLDSIKEGVRNNLIGQGISTAVEGVSSTASRFFDSFMERPIGQAIARTPEDVERAFGEEGTLNIASENFGRPVTRFSQAADRRRQAGDLPQVKNPKLIEQDARFGELGALRHSSGSTSTELSVTENVPDLGGWVNIPLLVKGQTNIDGILSGDIKPENYRIAVERARERVAAGATLPSYNSVEEAVAAAEGRTEAEKNRPFEQVATAEEPVAGGGEAIDITKGAEQVTLEGETPEVAKQNNTYAREFWEMLNRGDRHIFFNTIDPTKKDGEIVPVKNNRTGETLNFKFMGGVPVEVNGRRFR